jgi:hypothetical protein
MSKALELERNSQALAKSAMTYVDYFEEAKRKREPDTERYIGPMVQLALQALSLAFARIV